MFIVFIVVMRTLYLYFDSTNVVFIVLNSGKFNNIFYIVTAFSTKVSKESYRPIEIFAVSSLVIKNAW